MGPVLLASSLGCASSTLPVRRVVIYRNGIAYFERSGHVERDRVQFAMKAGAVGDFLATLAVTEKGGGQSVRTVELDGRGPDAAERTSAKETVVLSLDGKPHDLSVGYVAESPVWKPSYRLVVHAGGSARLQMWGIVENFSGEDWKNVTLSLVAGAPIAYSSDLGTPVTPTRPIVTDRGQEPLGVPRSDTYGYHALDQAMTQTQVSAQMQAGSRDARAPATPARTLARMAAAQRLPRDAAADAASARYEVPVPVSVADQSASMVMVLDHAVKGETVLLYAPDDAVEESATHAFRAVRFENQTGRALEAGPMAVFEDGVFLGQAVTEMLPAGSSGTVPFALERDVIVTRDGRTGDVSGPLVRGPGGGLDVDRERANVTTYRVRNASDEPKKIVIRHKRAEHTRLHRMPEGTQENVATGTALVPVSVAAQATAELVVDERSAAASGIDWLSPAADLTVKAFLADPRSDAAVVQKLAAAWQLRADLLKKQEDKSNAQLQYYDLTRENVMHPTPESAARVAAVTHKVAELEKKIAALGAQFEKAIGEIRW
jgi:hypothetical protein